MTEKQIKEKQKKFRNKCKRNVCQPVSMGKIADCQPIATSSKRGRRECQPTTFSVKGLETELLCEMQALRIPPGTAEVMAEKIAEAVEGWTRKRSVITDEDMWRRIAKEAEKYSADLAYVYQNRGKII